MHQIIEKANYLKKKEVKVIINLKIAIDKLFQ